MTSLEVIRQACSDVRHRPGRDRGSTVIDRTRPRRVARVWPGTGVLFDLFKHSRLFAAPHADP